MIPYTPNLNHRQTDQHLLVPDVSRIPKSQKDMSKKDIRDHTYLSYLRYSDYSGCRSKNVDLRILYPMFTCRKIVFLKHGRHLAASLNSSLDIWLDDCGLQEMREGEFLPFLGLTYIWHHMTMGQKHGILMKPRKAGILRWSSPSNMAFDRYWSIHITWLSSRPKCPQGSPFLRRSPCGACWQGGRGRGFFHLVLPLSYVY